MTLVTSVEDQVHVALNNTSAVLTAMHSGMNFISCCTIYLTDLLDRDAVDMYLSKYDYSKRKPIFTYVEVPSLPKSASVEFQVLALMKDSTSSNELHTLDYGKYLDELILIPFERKITITGGYLFKLSHALPFAS